MLARINKAMAKKDSGFTLIELLVVVIIIGILAAIAIPTFLSQRQNGWRAQVTSDLRNAVTNAEAYAVGQNGVYTGFDVDDASVGLGGTGGVLENTTLVVPAAMVSTTDFCIQGTSVADTSLILNYRKSTDDITTGVCV